MVIDFDDLPATCGWSSTPGALSDEYAEYGVTFEGPGGLDGGAVIDELKVPHIP